MLQVLESAVQYTHQLPLEKNVKLYNEFSAMVLSSSLGH